MITLTKEDAQNLLAALEELNRLSTGKNAICLPAEIDNAIEILEARLSAPEPEQRAWGVPNTSLTEKAQFMMLLHSKDGVQYPELLVPLYTAPPQREWQGLTDEEIQDIYFGSFSISQLHEFARAIEAKLKQRNL